MSPATAGLLLSNFDTMAENAASDSLGSNFIGAAFFLAQPIGGLLVIIFHSSVKLWQ